MSNYYPEFNTRTYLTGLQKATSNYSPSALAAPKFYTPTAKKAATKSSTFGSSLTTAKAKAAAKSKAAKEAAAKKAAAAKKSSSSGSVVSGSSGSGSSSKTTTPSAGSWASPISAGPDIYAPLQAQIGALKDQYAKLQAGYTPTEFAYGQAQGRDAFTEEAAARADAQTQATIAALAGQGTTATNVYEQALAANAASLGAQMQGLGAGESQDIGRMQAMAANSGMTAGFGNLQNTYGVTNDYAAQRAAAMQQASLANQEANMGLANARAGIAGQVSAANAGNMALRGDIQDRVYGQYNDQFNADRNMAFGAWQSAEQQRAAADAARLEAAFTALQGQSSMLQNSMTMAQDARDFSNNNAWLNKNFGYTQYQDNRNYDLQRATNSQNYNLTAQQIAQANRDSTLNAQISNNSTSAANEQYMKTLYLQSPEAATMNYLQWKTKYGI